jgi:hypothetical protein
MINKKITSSYKTVSMDDLTEPADKSFNKKQNEMKEISF